MSKILSFRTIRLSSTNVSKSRDYYQELFDLKPIEDQPNFVSFLVNDIYFDISKADSKSPSSKGGSIGYWLVSDLNHYIEKAEQLGGKVYRGPLEVKETGTRIIQIIDPYENVVRFEEVL